MKPKPKPYPNQSYISIMSVDQLVSPNVNSSSVPRAVAAEVATFRALSGRSMPYHATPYICHVMCGVRCVVHGIIFMSPVCVSPGLSPSVRMGMDRTGRPRDVGVGTNGAWLLG